jgi:Ala-tRNA(Pro) deacylase
MPPSAALTEALADRGIPFETLEHERTDRAVDEAAALGLEPHDVAKTIVVTSGEENVRVLLPASERLDMHKLRNLFDSRELHLLTEEDLARAYPEFELGAVPPIGGADDELVIDQRIPARRRVVFEAGRHDCSVRVESSDLVSLGRARVADVCLD